MKKITFILWIAGLYYPQFLTAKVLQSPDELHAVPTVLPSLHGFAIEANDIYLFGHRLDEYVRMPFNAVGRTRVERFGEYISSQRIKSPQTKYPGEWRGIILNQEKKRLLWDASMMQLVLFNPDGNKIIQEVTIPVDRLKPPADSMGEPTAKETERLRKKFKSSYRKVFGVRYTGLSRLPEGWFPGKKTTYLIATKIPNFPLLQMGCDVDDPMTCMMERFCYLEGGPALGPNGLNGVATFQKGKERLIAVGGSDRKSIRIYRWESCFNIRYQYVLELPAMLQQITALYIDSADRLWVATEKWENNFDSNLYYWDKESWQ